MPRSITYLKTHSQIFVPSIGVLGDTLTPNGSSVKSMDLKMVEAQYGVEITTKGQTLLIPYGNIVLALFGAELSQVTAQVIPHATASKKNLSSVA